MWRRRHPTTDEFREEIEAHVAIETDRLVQEGLNPDEAARAARRVFGNSTNVRERFYESRRILWLDHRLQDIQFAFRSLGRSPGFAILAILILAVGIGANTAIFSVVNAVLLRPLPYTNAGHLVLVEHPPVSNSPAWLTAAWRARAHTLETFAGFQDAASATLVIRGEPVSVQAAQVTWDFFPLLGVRPALGTFFSESDAQASPPAVAVLSHSFWVRQFGGDPSVLGQTMTLTAFTSDRVTIVGITGRTFRYPRAQPDEPKTRFGDTQPEVIRLRRSDTWLQILGRLSAASTPASASAELSGIFKQEGRREFVASFLEKTNVVVTPLQERLVGNTRYRLLILMGAVGCVLLVACANVANLVLARLTDRRPEFAVRMALGARSSRLIGMVLTETLLLGALASLAALLFAYWTAGVVRAMVAADVSHVDRIPIDWRVLAFNALLATLVGVLSGLAALMTVRPGRVASALYLAGGRSATGGTRLRHTLLVAEVAVTFVLVASAGLLTRTLWNLYHAPRGFDGARVLTAGVMPNMSGTIPELQHLTSSFFDDLMPRISALPGVDSAAAASNIPFGGVGMGMSGVSIVGGTSSPTDETSVGAAAVTPGYFPTIGARLTAGRDFTRSDVAGSERVTMVNEALRTQIAPGRDIVGAPLRFGRQQLTIVGIVDDMPDTSLRHPARAFVYLPLSQTIGTNFAWGRLTILARTRTTNPGTLAPAIRQATWALGNDIVIDEVATMKERLARSVRMEWDSALLFGLLAGLALVVAAAGVYGTVAYSVARRTREIGIRMALGAFGGRVAGDMVRESARPLIAGIAIGLAASLVATRALASLLFETQPADPLTLAETALILAITALIAAWIPARRAARVDPVTALRTE